MKIFLANQSKQSLGGGWTFLRNFKKYGERLSLKFVDNMEDCDVFFISGATMVQRDQVIKAKEAGKKIVLRVDNIPRNSRNRGTGTTRLYDFAQLADLVIYQSHWAKDFISPFLKKDGPVILNGTDHEIFNPDGPAQPKEGEPQAIFVQYNRDESKQWYKAWYQYILLQRLHPQAHLWIVGNFSSENIEYKFDFFQDERFRYIGVLENPADLAEYYRSSVLMYSYFNDACSNTLIEWLLCQSEDWQKELSKTLINTITLTGGAEEIFEQFRADRKVLQADNMVRNYIREIKNV